VAKAETHFDTMSGADRRKALDAVDWYIEGLRQRGRTLIPAIVTYLTGGAWRYREEAERAKADARERRRDAVAVPEADTKPRVFVARTDPQWNDIVHASQRGDPPCFKSKTHGAEGWIFDKVVVDMVRSPGADPPDEDAAE